MSETELVNNATPAAAAAAVVPTIDAAADDADFAKVGSKTGQCKWFSNVHGYGFLTVCPGHDDAGVDVFVHHSGIRPANSLYKTLLKGEYVTFDIADGAQGAQAVNVRGIAGGSLMCDHIPVRRGGGSAVTPAAVAGGNNKAAVAGRNNAAGGGRNGKDGSRRGAARAAAAASAAAAAIAPRS